MSTRYAIIEDESIAARRLQMLVERLRPQWELMFTSLTVADSVRRFTEGEKPDIVFLDIELADGNSFEIFEQVNLDVPVIFTTAYEEYALRAFKVHSVDYLLKPVEEGALSLALGKFERHHVLPSSAAAAASAIRTEMTARHDRILLSSGDNYSYINIADIAYAESEDNLIFIYPSRGPRRLTSFTSLGELIPRLPQERFFQLNRSVIASIDAIEGVSKYFRGRLIVKLSADGKITSHTLAAARRDDFLGWLGR